MAALSEADVECLVCLRVFDAKEREPLLLPCTHTVCKACVQVRARWKTGDRCPYCGTVGAWGKQASDCG